MNDSKLYACEGCGADTWGRGVATDSGTLCLNCYRILEMTEMAEHKGLRRLIKDDEITENQLYMRLSEMDAQHADYVLSGGTKGRPKSAALVAWLERRTKKKK